MGGFVAAVAAAQRARRVREIAGHLRDQKALSPETAAPVRPQPMMGRQALRSMVRDGSVVSAGEDRYWLDEVAYAAARQKRVGRVMWILALAVFAVAAIFLLVRGR